MLPVFLFSEVSLFCKVLIGTVFRNKLIRYSYGKNKYIWYVDA